MARLIWDAVGEHLYETGVRKGVLYLYDEIEGNYPNGVAWNGLTAVTESPSGAEPTGIYADDIKYLNLYSAEEFGATIEAYTYPDEFGECDGTAVVANGARVGQQLRKSFGLCYRTALGNDVVGDDYGYKIHLIYGCKASPSEKSYQTINDSPEAITFSWEVTTAPIAVDEHKPTANLIIDSTKLTGKYAPALHKIEANLYGADDTAFSASNTYALGNTCTSDGNFYVCTSLPSAGSSPSIANNFTLVESTSEWDGAPRLLFPDAIKAIVDAYNS